MVERTATIRNAMGIHCRPSSVILKTVKDYQGKIKVFTDQGTSELTSVMDLLSLCLECGKMITIRVEGPREEAMCADLVKLFETHFDFPPRQ